MRYAFVRFKISEGVFYIPEPERSGLAVGDLVVIDGDRGENVGTIVADVSHSQPAERNLAIPAILRRALNKDRKKFFQARRKESFANSVASDLARDLGLQMQVLDSEFQTDLMKVTLYYRSLCDGPVDFRQLQRSLFKQFRCRIWLVNWDSEFQGHRQQLQASVLPPMDNSHAKHPVIGGQFAAGQPFICH
jgi:cell fate regulator YaaT (PSP1 superfamily)